MTKKSNLEYSLHYAKLHANSFSGIIRRLQANELKAFGRVAELERQLRPVYANPQDIALFHNLPARGA